MPFRPEYSSAHPPARTRSLRRARLFVGGTYFRTREPGAWGNNVSVQAIEFTPVGGTLTGKLIVTNHNTLPAENVQGPTDVVFLDQSLRWDEQYIVEDLTTAPMLKRHLLDRQLVAVEPPELIGSFTFSKLFYLPSKLGVILSPRLLEFTQNSTIVIKSRVKMYDLVLKTDVSGAENGGQEISTTGWDVDALRAAVADDPWIEMLPRSGTPAAGADGTPGVPLAVKFDEQDDGIDTEYLTPFAEMRLVGGDGLPDRPTPDPSGLSGFMLHVNASEQPNGLVEDVYEMYEWDGGGWRRF